MGYEAILVFFIAGVFLIVLANFLSNLISHKSDNAAKKEPYEFLDHGTLEATALADRLGAGPVRDRRQHPAAKPRQSHKLQPRSSI